MKLNLQSITFFLMGLIISLNTYAQVDFNKPPNDDLGENEDAFQDAFFEALKQKGIENYDKAIDALQECLVLNDAEPVVYFELGKSYNKLKRFNEAETALKKASHKMPDNEWVLDELYDVYMQQKNYDEAIKTVRQLVKYHPDYKEDLAGILFSMSQYDEALKILDDLDAELGINPRRDKLRNSIYSATGRKKEQIQNLENRVSKNPKSEENYLALIYRYSANNQKEKAFETAEKLQQIHPNSELVHLALYKFYLDKGNADKAISSMQVVVKSSSIKPDAKVKVLKDFVAFVAKNPQYEDDLIKATIAISESENNLDALVEMAQFHLAKNEKSKALHYYKKALVKAPNNFDILRNVLLLYIDVGELEMASEKSKWALESYPSQPIVYLINGVALNNLKKHQQAIESLQMGLDYIIDDPKMEADFYIELSKAYTGLDNLEKAKTFKDKAQKLVFSD